MFDRCGLMAVSFRAVARKFAMSFDDYRARERIRLNCETWSGRRVASMPPSRAERDKERDARAWAYARQHRVSYHAACRELFDDDDDS